MHLSSQHVRSRMLSHLNLWVPLRAGLMICAATCGLLQPALPSVASPLNVYRTAKSTPPPPPPPPLQSGNIAAMEQQLLQQINQQRQEHGLSPLRSSPKLSQVARLYSQQMATQNFYGHISPAGTTHRQRIEAAGIRAALVGENLMKIDERNHPPVDVSVQGWMKIALVTARISCFPK